MSSPKWMTGQQQKKAYADYEAAILTKPEGYIAGELEKVKAFGEPPIS